MQVISLSIRYRKTVRPLRTIPPRPYATPSIAPSRGLWPGRGLVYSFLFHEITFFGLLFLSSYTFDKAGNPDEHVEIIQFSRNQVLQLPGLSSEPAGAEPAGAKSPAGPAEGGNETTSGGGNETTRGLSYPGLQNVVSNPARPTNHFQTLLQPALVNPPTLRPPLTLPNIIQMTNARPQLAGPPSPPTKEPSRVLALDQPARIAETRIPSINIPSPAPVTGMLATAPPSTLPAEMRQIEQPDGLTPRLAGMTPFRATTIPEIRATPPPMAAVDGPAAIALAPKLPARLAAGQVVPAATTQGQVPTAPPKVLPNAVSSVLPPSEVATSTKRAPAPTTGTDPRNLLAVSPLPPPPEPQIRLPAGEARGRVALSTNPNLTGAADTPGVKTENSPASKPVLTAENSSPAALNGGGAKDSTAGKFASGKDDPRNDNSGGGASANAGNIAAPKTEQLSGRVAANTSSPGPGNPFAGITIQGGRLEPAGPRIGTTSPGIITLTQPGQPVPASGGYNITIVATAGSGGGLPDFGVFSNEQVYTVYLDVKPTPEAAGRSWTLQYAVVDAKRPASAPATTQERGITPPFPIAKEYPQFPAELLRKYPQRLLVLYAIIDTNGKLQQMSVKQTPDPELNTPLLAALSKWTFRPVELDGRPAAAKILLGIPLVP